MRVGSASIADPVNDELLRLACQRREAKLDPTDNSVAE
jgi:hypothetical protein